MSAERGGKVASVYVNICDKVTLNERQIRKIEIENGWVRIETTNIINGAMTEEKTYTAPIDKVEISINTERAERGVLNAER